MCPERKVILLERQHSAAERRCSLAHAVAHIDLGHTSESGWWSARQEAAADRLAARRLLPIYPLADAAVWAESHAELARELGVDAHMLAVRARGLHPAERAYIRARLDAKPLIA
jgi:Zn-dependent peptidase ImmA (M78 family)